MGTEMSHGFGSLAVFLIMVVAGCVNPAPESPEPLGLAGVFDAPHCIGACARVVDGSPVRAWEPFLAVNPRNPDHIVIVTGQMSDGFLDPSFTLGKTRVSVSEDAGATWETRIIPSGLESGAADPRATYASSDGDPVLVFLPDGTLVMSSLATTMLAIPGLPVQVWPGAAVYTTRSTDGGRTWTDVRILDRGEGVVAFDTVVGTGAGAMWKFNDKEWLTVGPDGTLLLVWSQFTYMHPDDGFNVEGGGRLVFSSSTDGGLTWSPIGVVDADGRGHGASPVIGTDGAWRVAYYHRTSDALRFAESHDRGKTWDARTIGSTSWMPVMRAQTLSSGGERLLLVYTTGGEERWGQHQTELTWSDDGGATWATPLVIDTPQGEGAPMPDVAGAPGDTAWVTFFDIEGAYAEQHLRYLAVKVVDGVAGEPVVLDEMDTAAANLGHYMGLAVGPEGDALVAWVTYEDGEYDLAWARVAAGAE